MCQWMALSYALTYILALLRPNYIFIRRVVEHIHGKHSQ